MGNSIEIYIFLGTAFVIFLLITKRQSKLNKKASAMITLQQVLLFIFICFVLIILYVLFAFLMCPSLGWDFCSPRWFF